MSNFLLDFVHRRCRGQEVAWAQERDRLESSLFRLQKQYDTLMESYRALAESTVTQLRPPSLWDHLFVEQDTPREKMEFLTPEREEE